LIEDLPSDLAVGLGAVLIASRQVRVCIH
jgi:hypothetical protein